MTNVVKIDSHGRSVETEVFMGRGASSQGAIVLAHGSDGMNEPWATMIRLYAGEMAEAGFTSLIPHYFGDAGAGAGTNYVQLRQCLLQWQEAVRDTAVYAAALPGVPAARIGLLGFSLGGHICLRLRGTAPALVAYFAPELAEFGGLNFPSAPATHVQIHHGLADIVVPFSDARSIVQGLAREGTDTELFSYEGAGHGFAGSDANNATASRSSRARTVSFFERHLS